MRLVGIPVKLSDTPGRLRMPPPTVGQDNDTVLAGLGLSSEEIEVLRKAGVIGDENGRVRDGGPASW